MPLALGLGNGLPFGGSQVSGAALLLAGESDGLALDFTFHNGSVGDAQVKDTSTPANVFRGAPYDLLTQTGRSVKNTMQADGTIKHGAHNLFLNSGSVATQSITVKVGCTYKIIVTGSGTLTASNSFTGAATDGSPVTGTATTTTLTLTLTGSLDTAHVVQTPADETYLETTGSAVYQLPYEWDTSGNSLGILVEEQRTNLQVYNTQLDNAAWSGSGGSISSGSEISPDGQTVANLYTEDTNTSTHIRYDQLTLAADTTVAISVFAKAGTCDFFFLNLQGGSEEHACAVFDLNAVSVSETEVGTTSGTITSTSITSVGNGWYRCVIVCSVSVVNPFLVFGTAEASTGNTFDAFGQVSFTGSSRTFSLWGIQAEAGSFPTSPIITGSATVTRAADNITLALSATPLPDMTTTNDVISFYGQGEVIDGSIARQFTLDDGGTSDRISVYESSLSLQLENVSSGGDNDVLSISGITYGTYYQYAGRSTEDDTAWSIEGKTQVTDSTFDLMADPLTTLRIGRFSSGNIANSHISKLVFVPTSWSNSVLESKVGN